ncbi:ROK family protein [Elusimicrobiota bacterium]
MTADEEILAALITMRAKDSTYTYFSLDGSLMDAKALVESDDRLMPVAELLIDRAFFKRVKEDFLARIENNTDLRDKNGNKIVTIVRDGPNYANMVFGGISKINYIYGNLHDPKVKGKTLFFMGDSSTDQGESPHIARSFLDEDMFKEAMKEMPARVIDDRMMTVTKGKKKSRVAVEVIGTQGISRLNLTGYGRLTDKEYEMLKERSPGDAKWVQAIDDLRRTGRAEYREKVSPELAKRFNLHIKGDDRMVEYGGWIDEDKYQEMRDMFEDEAWLEAVERMNRLTNEVYKEHMIFRFLFRNDMVELDDNERMRMVEDGLIRVESLNANLEPMGDGYRRERQGPTEFYPLLEAQVEVAKQKRIHGAAGMNAKRLENVRAVIEELNRMKVTGFRVLTPLGLKLTEGEVPSWLEIEKKPEKKKPEKEKLKEFEVAEKATGTDELGRIFEKNHEASRMIRSISALIRNIENGYYTEEDKNINIVKLVKALKNGNIKVEDKLSTEGWGKLYIEDELVIEVPLGYQTGSEEMPESSVVPGYFSFPYANTDRMQFNFEGITVYIHLNGQIRTVSEIAGAEIPKEIKFRMNIGGIMHNIPVPLKIGSAEELMSTTAILKQMQAVDEYLISINKKRIFKPVFNVYTSRMDKEEYDGYFLEWIMKNPYLYAAGLGEANDTLKTIIGFNANVLAVLIKMTKAGEINSHEGEVNKITDWKDIDTLQIGGGLLNNKAYVDIYRKIIERELPGVKVFGAGESENAAIIGAASLVSNKEKADKVVIGIDVGGTSVKIAAVEFDKSGNVVKIVKNSFIRIKPDHSKGKRKGYYTEIRNTIDGLKEQLEKEGYKVAEKIGVSHLGKEKYGLIADGTNPNMGPEGKAVFEGINPIKEITGSKNKGVWANDALAQAVAGYKLSKEKFKKTVMMYAGPGAGLGTAFIETDENGDILRTRDSHIQHDPRIAGIAAEEFRIRIPWREIIGWLNECDELGKSVEEAYGELLNVFFNRIRKDEQEKVISQIGIFADKRSATPMVLASRKLLIKIGKSDKSLVLRGKIKSEKEFTSLDISPDEAISVAVYIEGTETTAALIDSKANILRASVIKTPDQEKGAKANDVVKAALKEINRLIDDNSITLNQLNEVGIIFEGPLDLEKGVVGVPFKAPNLPFKNYDLKGKMEKELRKRYGQPINVRLLHDGVAVVLAEKSPKGRLGMMPSTDGNNFIRVIWHTGIGQGVMVEGRMDLGGEELGNKLGELGVLTVRKPDGHYEFRGYKSRGNMPKLEKGEQNLENIASLNTLKKETGMTLEEIKAAYKEGNEKVVEKVHYMAEEMGKGLAAFIHSYKKKADISKIIIGGGFADISTDYNMENIVQHSMLEELETNFSNTEYYPISFSYIKHQRDLLSVFAPPSKYDIARDLVIKGDVALPDGTGTINVQEILNNSRLSAVPGEEIFKGVEINTDGSNLILIHEYLMAEYTAPELALYLIRKAVQIHGLRNKWPKKETERILNYARYLGLVQLGITEPESFEDVKGMKTWYGKGLPSQELINMTSFKGTDILGDIEIALGEETSYQKDRKIDKLTISKGVYNKLIDLTVKSGNPEIARNLIKIIKIDQMGKDRTGKELFEFYKNQLGRDLTEIEMIALPLWFNEIYPLNINMKPAYIEEYIRRKIADEVMIINPKKAWQIIDRVVKYNEQFLGEERVVQAPKAADAMAPGKAKKTLIDRIPGLRQLLNIFNRFRSAVVGLPLVGLNEINPLSTTRSRITVIMAAALGESGGKYSIERVLELLRGIFRGRKEEGIAPNLNELMAVYIQT